MAYMVGQHRYTCPRQLLRLILFVEPSGGAGLREDCFSLLRSKRTVSGQFFCVADDGVGSRDLYTLVGGIVNIHLLYCAEILSD